MKDILRNLALIELNRFCKEHRIDISGTRVQKAERGYTYCLIADEGLRLVATVTFHKSQVPTFTVDQGLLQ